MPQRSDTRTRRKGGRVEGLDERQRLQAKKIGRRIHQLILEKGHRSLSSFSAAANARGEAHIWPGDLAKIVRGLRSPTVKVLVRLAAVLGEDPFQLLVLPSESRRQELVDLIRHAPPATIERLLRALTEGRPPRRSR